MHLREIAKKAHEISVAHGWYDAIKTDTVPVSVGPQSNVLQIKEMLDTLARTVPEKLMLIACEAAEAMEEYRIMRFPSDLSLLPDLLPKQKPEGMASELADIIIRVCDLAEFLGIDIEAAVIQKQTYNETRPYRHGGKIALWQS